MPGDAIARLLAPVDACPVKGPVSLSRPGLTAPASSVAPASPASTIVVAPTPKPYVTWDGGPEINRLQAMVDRRNGSRKSGGKVGRPCKHTAPVTAEENSDPQKQAADAMEVESS